MIARPKISQNEWKAADVDLDAPRRGGGEVEEAVQRRGRVRRVLDDDGLGDGRVAEGRGQRHGAVLAVARLREVAAGLGLLL